MGSIITRGTKAAPRYYLYFREGSKPDGSPIYRMKAAKGARNKAEARTALADAESRIARGEPGIAPPVVSQDVSVLLQEWADTINNRHAVDDRRIILRDLVPAFKGNDIADITVPVIMRWLDKLAKSSLSGQSQRHRLTYLSRFFSWCVERGLAEVNPCLSVPRGKRPNITRNNEVPWLKDDTMIPKIINGLGGELGLMFYLCRFSGMRLGEVCGLRVKDMAWLSEGRIYVGHSYNGPLKEDKKQTGKFKWVPAPSDAGQMLGGLIEARRAKDGPEALLFVYGKGSGKRDGQWLGWAGWHPHTVQAEFKKVAESLGLIDLDWYRSTRHSFATKALEAGASIDEVSAALGHSSVIVTKKYYSHFIRERWSSAVVSGLSPQV